MDDYSFIARFVRSFSAPFCAVDRCAPGPTRVPAAGSVVGSTSLVVSLTEGDRAERLATFVISVILPPI